MAKVSLAENIKAYPEYDMFGDVMPAYGINGAARAGDDTEGGADDSRPTGLARPANVFIDVNGVTGLGLLQRHPKQWSHRRRRGDQQFRLAWAVGWFSRKRLRPLP